MKDNKRKWWLVLVMLVMSCAASADEETVSATLDTDIDDARADANGTWRVKTDGMTMWIDTVLEPGEAHGRTFWTMRGRVSKTLTGVRAYTGSGYHFNAKMVSARKFEAVLSESEALDVIGGSRVYLDFFAERGDTPIYHGTTRFAARFANWAGSSDIYVYRAINPVIVGDGLKFRGRASTRPGFELDLVYTDDDAGPVLYDDEPNKYHFDWSPAALHLAADPPTDPVWFRGSDVDSTPVEKTASIELRLVQLGLGTEAPFTAWPPQRCDRGLKSCLRNLDDADTEACGWANEVRACMGRVELPAAADPERFKADLENAIRSWYVTHEADVRAMGGRTLPAALAQIKLEKVGEVEGEEVDLFGYDPAHFDMFFHPDPVFDGSDRVWYGTYDHGGTLIQMEAVN